MVNLDYGRTPEHRFPVAYRQCCEASVWLADNAAEQGIDAAWELIAESLIEAFRRAWANGDGQARFMMLVRLPCRLRPVAVVTFAITTVNREFCPNSKSAWAAFPPPAPAHAASVELMAFHNKTV